MRLRRAMRKGLVRIAAIVARIVAHSAYRCRMVKSDG
jgi:hypothetical protein